MSKDTAAQQARRLQRREERTQQILDAALEVILEHGVDGLTIQRMAKKLMWSVGALYRYFPGKEAVIAHLQIRVLAELGDAIVARVEAMGELPGISGLPPGDRAVAALLAAADCYRQEALEVPARFLLVSAVIATPPAALEGEEAESVGAAFSGFLDRITRLVETATEHGSLGVGSAPERTLLLWSSVQGVLQMRKVATLDPRLDDLPGLVLALTESLLLGWGAPPSSLVFARSFIAST